MMYIATPHRATPTHRSCHVMQWLQAENSNYFTKISLFSLSYNVIPRSQVSKLKRPVSHCLLITTELANLLNNIDNAEKKPKLGLVHVVGVD
jgi:hypothetical protein